MKRRYTIEISDVDPNDATVRDAIWNLMLMIDHEFVPPLSSRESTTEMSLTRNEQNATSGPRAYFNNILNQNIIMAQIDGNWAGFLSFQHNYTLELLLEFNPCNYLTTIGVSPHYRNIGIARSMYRYILNDLAPELQAPYWATRTWSTNSDHLHLLDKIGFSCAAKIDNHRGDGIHTMYFVYQMAKHCYLTTKVNAQNKIKEPSPMEQA